MLYGFQTTVYLSVFDISVLKITSKDVGKCSLMMLSTCGSIVTQSN
jgi:hypothetical protein